MESPMLIFLFIIYAYLIYYLEEKLLKAKIYILFTKKLIHEMINRGDVLNLTIRWCSLSVNDLDTIRMCSDDLANKNRFKFGL